MSARTCAAGAVLAIAAGTPTPSPSPPAATPVATNSNALPSTVATAEEPASTAASVARGTTRRDHASAARDVDSPALTKQ